MNSLKSWIARRIAHYDGFGESTTVDALKDCMKQVDEVAARFGAQPDRVLCHVMSALSEFSRGEKCGRYAAEREIVRCLVGPS